MKRLMSVGALAVSWVWALSPALAGPVSGSSTWTPDEASAYVFGSFLVTGLHGGISTFANPDPVPGNIASFDFNLLVEGRYLSRNEVVTPEMLEMAEHGAATGQRIITQEYFLVDHHGLPYVTATEILDVDLNGNAGLLIPTVDEDFYGWTAFNVKIINGLITDAELTIYNNEWGGPGPRPVWLPDFSAALVGSGIVTAQDFSLVPEPSTLTLLALSGISVLWRARQHLP